MINGAPGHAAELKPTSTLLAASRNSTRTTAELSPIRGLSSEFRIFMDAVQA